MDSYYKILPHFLQNFAISIYNMLHYWIRYGGKYEFYLKVFKKNEDLSLAALKKIQYNNYTSFFDYTVSNSNFYKELYRSIDYDSNLDTIAKLPLVSKEMIRENSATAHTIPFKKRQLVQTGGTTGKSLEVLYTRSNMQERFAMLDTFRSKFGYKLGKKTAWFSGKNIIYTTDIKKNRFWKTDYFYKIRYYSTFHLQSKNLSYYLYNLIKYKPKFLIGYPSSMLEIAKYGIANGISFPADTVEAIFPTAESFTLKNKKVLEAYFKTNAYDQYASSEGAPFITECSHRNLHMQLQSGVFEVLDAYDNPAKNGRLVVTSFTTYGTPLIRYDIGDSIELKESVCTCGNNNPLVEKIMGREDDFVYSQEIGKINLGNVSNTLKGVEGIIKFQVIQDSLTQLNIYIIIDIKQFNDEMELQFIENWRHRVGKNMELTIIKTENIPAEKSGKYRMVKNNIKHLL